MTPIWKNPKNASCGILILKKQKTLTDVKRVESRHVFHDLVGKEGIVETLSEQSVTLVHLDLCNETETHGQVQRVLIHDSPKEAAFKGNV